METNPNTTSFALVENIQLLIVPITFQELANANNYEWSECGGTLGNFHRKELAGRNTIVEI